MKTRNTFIGIIIALLFTSCGSEIKLANQFVAQSRQTQAAVYFPESAQVTLIQAEDGAYTSVLDSLNQNTFLDVMYLAYADALSQYGVNVYVPDDPDHVPVDSTHWLVVLSHMEIQGLFTDYVDRLFDFIDEYEYSFSLNTVNVASWFDINDGEWHPTLFDEHNLVDDFDSYVDQSSVDVAQYHYDIKTITNNDLYDYAVFLGKRYAACTYDYMRNRYIGAEMRKADKSARFQLRWDPSEKLFYFQQEGEGFIELKAES